MKAAYRHLLAERRETLRLELENALQGRNELVGEVGCGHGHFLTAYAAAHPAQCCVGIDLVGERIERARRKQARAGLPNLHFLRGEARLFLEVMPAGTRFTRLFVLFPDPWPKLRHQKHRILQTQFLDSVAARAAPGCRLYFRTDYRPYFEEVQVTLGAHSQWKLVAEPWPFEFSTVFQQRAPSFDSLIAAREGGDH
jgi:tRNA (guanine-N7-)-methyltransferase